MLSKTRCRCLACLYDNWGFEVQERPLLQRCKLVQITEMETGSDVRYVERIFNMVKFAQRAVRQDLCPSMDHLTFLGS